MKLFKYFLLLSCFSCVKNNNIFVQKTMRFKDFDFINYQGRDAVDSKVKDGVINVVNGKDKITLSVNFFENSNVNFNNVFSKNEDYYINYQEYNEDDPNIKVKETFYLKNGIGMKFHLTYDNNKPDFCRISEINFSKKLIREVEFYKYDISPSPDITFDKLKDNKNIFQINEIEISEVNDKLVKKMKVTDFKTKEVTNFTSYYTGYPDSKINQYWNLYRYYFGKEIR
ncbi:hypothetical protein RF683_05340 [Flavobacterium sp. 20NA77.7]|uniref:Lipoprotein n=1 Tax=Flavobacterium nakdongensis TaxID=3073563 RepID=A0ABY9R6N1_9FLAO|nr:hypothetical protein [Flavobacterium sp. 20NA77.7]WMW76925.1 hypothetical protein RF683_05340 [Flavobacterium sp. 20NA77.7]